MSKRKLEDPTPADGIKVFKKERNLSSSESEEELSSPSYASFLHFDQKPVYSDVVKKQMERMGYKEGTVLGKSTQGQSKLLDNVKKENSLKDEKPAVPENTSQPESGYSDFAQRQMVLKIESMGFEPGRGLGRYGQGRQDIIEASQQRGRRGLGFRVEGFDDKDFTWEEEEEVVIEELKACIPSCTRPPPTREEMEDWITVGKKRKTIDNEIQFCSEDVLSEILKSNSIFDALVGDEFLKARTRANPYEFVRGAIFQNRAAMKMANMDSAFDFMFTNPKNDRGREVVGPNELLYFADVCAGPGGFSEYVLWRKGWQAKGFGFTLKGDCDFKLEEFLAGTPETFEPHYGVHDDGDIFNEENLVEFRRFVMEATDNKGVHFVMADGGFSVAGQENIQEILSKQLYLCQFLCALSILRQGGHFVCKVFDLFTPFSVGLVYLMYRVFDELYVFKPVTSRPANSERYIVCKGLWGNSEAVHEHMFNVNVRINRLKAQDLEDVNEIVPLHILMEDEEFSSYMAESNDKIGRIQANSLKKLRAYVQDTTLMGHYDQGEVKKRCLEMWKIPEQARAAHRAADPDVKFDELWKGIDDDHCFDAEATMVTSQNIQNLKCLFNYKCFVSGGDRFFIMGLGRSNVYKWDGKPNFRSSIRWHKLENFNLELPRDTLIEVEIVQELRGEGKGQRRAAAVHIVDAVILGGKDVRSKHYHERMAMAGLLVKAVNKPTRPEMVPLRLKQVFRLDSSSLKDIFSRIEMKVVKGMGRVPRECFVLEDGSHLLPKGIFFIKRIQEPWTYAHSRTAKRLYFYNKDTNESTFESPRDSVASFNPESGGPTETRTTLDRTSPIGTPRVEGIVEQIQAKTSTDDVEAIKDILSEISDISVSVPQPAELSRSSSPQSFKSAGVDSSYRSPVLSEGSGTFENATQRKKSHPHSDKGYSSTTSVSSGSSGDNVFLPDSPKIPGLKFDRDTSSFWYKPSITRNDANDILKDSAPGSFIIRDSQSFPGAFGLAVKVAVPPAHVIQGLQGDLTKVDLDNELVRHFLIETTKKGVRLKGYNDEPVFGSLAAFVYQHSITPLALPIRLTMPSRDLLSEDKDQTTEEDGQSWPQGAVGSLMYLGCCEVEMLTGPSAIQRTVEQLSTEDAAKKFTTISFKVTPQGMTVTDNERKVFFRQHFHMKSILYCGIDPSDKRWDLKTTTYSGKSKSFGLVLRQTGGVHNECHLFGEISKDWPSSILVNILNRSMTSST